MIARKCINFLKDKESDAVIIACNTISTTVFKHLEKFYDFPIIPITDWIKSYRINGNVKLLGTPNTVNSSFYQRYMKCEGIPDPNLANFVEKGIWDGEVEEYLEGILPTGEYALVLACTHYSVLNGVIGKLRPEVRIIDISDMFVEHLKSVIDFSKINRGNSSTIYFTSKDDNLMKMVDKLGLSGMVDVEFIDPL